MVIKFLYTTKNIKLLIEIILLYESTLYKIKNFIILYLCKQIIKLKYLLE